MTSKNPDEELREAERAAAEAEGRRRAAQAALRQREERERLEAAGPTAVWADSVSRVNPDYEAVKETWAAFVAAVAAGDAAAIFAAYRRYSEARAEGNYVAHRRHQAATHLVRIGLAHSAPPMRLPWRDWEGFSASLDKAFDELVPHTDAALSERLGEEMEAEGVAWHDVPVTSRPTPRSPLDHVPPERLSPRQRMKSEPR